MTKATITTLCLAFIFFCIGCTTTAPSGREMGRWVRNAHIPIPIPAIKNGNTEITRLAILEGLTIRRGASWQLENESTGYITTRLDYRGSSVTIKIEYNDSEARLKYLQGNNNYACSDIDDGVCYDADRAYYSHVSRLRKNITRQIKIQYKNR